MAGRSAQRQRIGSEKNRMVEIQRTSGISMNLRHILLHRLDDWCILGDPLFYWAKKWAVVHRGLWRMIIQVAVGDQTEGFCWVFSEKLGNPWAQKTDLMMGFALSL